MILFQFKLSHGHPYTHYIVNTLPAARPRWQACTCILWRVHTHTHTHTHTHSYIPLQITPASSLWSHPLIPVLSMVQFSRFMSLLVHLALDKWTGPLPLPKNALLVGTPLSTECIIVIAYISACSTEMITLQHGSGLRILVLAAVDEYMIAIIWVLNYARNKLLKIYYSLQ